MRLRSRLSVIVGIALLSSGAVIGGASAWLSRSDAVQRIDNSLGLLTTRISADPANDVQTLLDSIETSPFPLIGVIYYDDADPFTVVEGHDGTTVLTLPPLPISRVEQAVDKPLTINGSSPLRIRATDSGGGQWIVVGTSLREVNSQFIDSLLQSLLVSALIALLAMYGIWLVLRRELSPIVRITESATAIASGDLGAELPVSAHTNEVGELSSALQAMTKKLREAVSITALSEQRMREFLGDASHELRTPLTVVRGYVDILFSGQQLSDEQRERAIRRLVSESRRMDLIINDLLLLAELGEEHMAFDDQVDLSRVVVDHFTDLGMHQPERKVTIDVQPSLTIEGNAAHLERLVANIKSNILRHTDQNVEVHVSLAQRDDDLVLVVDDAGPGLSPSLYQRNTTEFQRFDRSRSREGGGFGLGLSIIASIIHRHSGTLQLSPSDLGGLRTSVVLPTRQAPSN
ncbi:MAG: ATP-binding protein [Ilumatobacteraceae bacterium]